MSRERNPDPARRSHATAFLDPAVARAYLLRPPYPPELIDALGGLIHGSPRNVLDIGCGPGDLARPLVAACDRIDALDISLPMLEIGRGAPHGDDPRIRWLHGAAEVVPLDPPYALVVAGESIHWMDWPTLIPRLRSVLSPEGWLVVAGRRWGTGTPEEREVIERHSTNPSFRPHDAVDELVAMGFFNVAGRWTGTSVWTPTVEEYVTARHSQALMPSEPQAATAFDRDLFDVLGQLIAEGKVLVEHGRMQLTVDSGFSWGKPTGFDV